MERFILESMRIRDVPEIMKISSFINDVKHAQMCETLEEDFPKTFDVLMDKVCAFVRGKVVGNLVREYGGKKSGSFQNKGKGQKEAGSYS